MSEVPGTSLPWWLLRERRIREEHQLRLLRDPQLFHPFLRPCVNRVLLVVDGLDFSEGGFGLSFFVRTLLDAPGRHVRHAVTLAHLGPGPLQGTDTQMMPDEPRIVRRLRRFRFDDPDHFGPDMYDVVMLFGIQSTFFDRDPGDRLADAELQALTAFMNGGGGLFATGDHGALGRALGHAVPRVRNMRLWESTTGQEATDEVSMQGPLRNDTNRGSLFDDQSDDTPQRIDPAMYSAGFVFRARYPHPLLCGPHGVIRVMPDHPHEGECVEPPDPELELPFGGGAEYPPGTGGGPRPLPEVISTSAVPAGNTAEVSGTAKDATIPHRFGGICAYDGHRAGVGRVVTDATWHHFVNVNLVGIPGTPYDGFLTPQGAPVLRDVRAYHRNLVEWATRPERIRCMNLRLIWGVLVDDRVLEAVLTATRVRLAQVPPAVLRLIGVHARDALGRSAGQCQILDLVLTLVLERALPDLVPDIDPWWPDRRRRRPEGGQWVDGSPLADIGLGGALVGLREAFGEVPTEDGDELDQERLEDVVAEAGGYAVREAVRSMAEELGTVRAWLPE